MSYQKQVITRVVIGVGAVLALVLALYYSGFTPSKMTPVGMKEERDKARMLEQQAAPEKPVETPTPEVKKIEDFEDLDKANKTDDNAARRTVDFLFDDEPAPTPEPDEDQADRFDDMKQRLEAIGQDGPPPPPPARGGKMRIDRTE
jgi:hypothetical protein